MSPNWSEQALFERRRRCSSARPVPQRGSCRAARAVGYFVNNGDNFKMAQLERVRSIDFLRGITSLGVVIWHYQFFFRQQPLFYLFFAVI
jgi:hypothetical protein